MKKRMMVMMGLFVVSSFPLVEGMGVWVDVCFKLLMVVGRDVVFCFCGCGGFSCVCSSASQHPSMLKNALKSLDLLLQHGQSFSPSLNVGGLE